MWNYTNPGWADNKAPPQLNAQNLNNISNALGQLTITDEQLTALGATQDSKLGDILTALPGSGGSSEQLLEQYTYHFSGSWFSACSTIEISKDKTRARLSCTGTATAPSSSGNLSGVYLYFIAPSKYKFSFTSTNSTIYLLGTDFYGTGSASVSGKLSTITQTTPEETYGSSVWSFGYIPVSNLTPGIYTIFAREIPLGVTQ